MIWARFIALFLLAIGYLVALVAYTIQALMAQRHGLTALLDSAVQFSLAWAFLCLCLFARAVRPY